jgi:surfactin synthase thioesterase subunit
MTLPILVLGGQDDKETVPETLSAWDRETDGICTVQMLPGGHLFINHAGEDIVKLLENVLPAYQGEVRC